MKFSVAYFYQKCYKTSGRINKKDIPMGRKKQRPERFLSRNDPGLAAIKKIYKESTAHGRRAILASVRHIGRIDLELEEQIRKDYAKRPPEDD